MKTIYNKELSEKLLNQEVVLFGWVAAIRKMGSITFINLRDSTGIIQLVLKESHSHISKESVIKVRGKLVLRKSPNSKLKNGNLEVIVSSLKILSHATPIPFEIKDDAFASEDLRLKYRYLDLRKEKQFNNIKTRSYFIKAFRDFFFNKKFLEIETPILSKSTPEGAKDFLVMAEKKDYYFALPQSPQIYKQLLMVAGVEKYFQIARVFRNEDPRNDRQPEFTQLDVELSFATEKTIMTLMEEAIQFALKKIGIKVAIPFKKITYQESISKYKSDKPRINKNNKYEFIWVTNFPFYDQNDKSIMHHPFTKPKVTSIKDLNIHSSAYAYDLVFNGYEIGSGSIRNHNKSWQIHIFKSLGMSKKDIEAKFGFFLDAFNYGMPPHGGIALGLDRMLMILSNEESIKNVIPFPKNSKSIAPLEQAPTKIGSEKLKKYFSGKR